MFLAPAGCSIISAVHAHPLDGNDAGLIQMTDDVEQAQEQVLFVIGREKPLVVTSAC